MLYQSQHETRQFEWNTRIANRANVLFGILIRSHSVCVCVSVRQLMTSLLYIFISLPNNCIMLSLQFWPPGAIQIVRCRCEWTSDELTRDLCSESFLQSGATIFFGSDDSRSTTHEQQQRQVMSRPLTIKLCIENYLFILSMSKCSTYFFFFVPRLFIVSFFVRRQWVIRVAQFRCLFSSLHNAHGLKLHHTAMLFLGSWDAWTLLILINLCGCHFISKPFGDGSQQSVRR